MRSILVALALLAGTPTSVARLVYQGPPIDHNVTLTFDAGADRGYAASILTILERHHVHATFGMTGAWALANPDLVRRIARDGDTFINHTYDHRSFTGYSSHAGPLSERQRVWEITQTERIVHRLTGKTTKPYFRPPFGDLDTRVAPLAHRLGYDSVVMWTIDSLGWEGVSATAIVTRCLSQARPGAIFLMHVGSQSQDAVALPRVLAGLKRAGYAIVPLPRLLGHR